MLPGPKAAAPEAPMARIHARYSLEKTVRGYERTCARLESTERTANARRYPPRPPAFAVPAPRNFSRTARKETPPSDAGTRSRFPRRRALSRALSPALRPSRPRKASRQANRAVSSASLRSNDPPRSASPRLNGSAVRWRKRRLRQRGECHSAKPKPDISRASYDDPVRVRGPLPFGVAEIDCAGFCRDRLEKRYFVKSKTHVIGRKRRSAVRYVARVL